LTPKTIILPMPVPTVAFNVFVALEPDQPVPDTVQLKEVAPVEIAVYVADGAPAQGVVPGGVTTGKPGRLAGVTEIVSEGPLPQALIPYTIICPTPEPAVAFNVPVALVPDHPVPVTAQL
jgi:hypothetical protein